MNVIFAAVTLASAVILAFSDAEAFLPALIDGAEKTASTCLTLFCIYAVWMGLSKVSEDAGINSAIAKKARPLCFKIFRTRDEAAAEHAAMNITCNVIGLGGAATPYGIRAMREFDGRKNYYAKGLLFVLNATSVQIVPSTVIAIRAAAGSISPADIFGPALLTSLICTGGAVILYILSDKIWHLSSRRSL